MYTSIFQSFEHMKSNKTCLKLLFSEVFRYPEDWGSFLLCAFQSLQYFFTFILNNCSPSHTYSNLPSSYIHSYKPSSSTISLPFILINSYIPSTIISLPLFQLILIYLLPPSSLSLSSPFVPILILIYPLPPPPLSLSSSSHIHSEGSLFSRC